MSSFVCSSMLTARPLTGPAPRPVARARRMRFAVASTPKQGTYGGSTSPEGEDKQAKNEAAGLAPEGDKALEGEKVQMAGAAAPGPSDYDRSNTVEGAEKTTPASQPSGEKK